MATFEELVDEGASVPVEGWDFSWFAGRVGTPSGATPERPPGEAGPPRATEERPPWGYARLIGRRMAEIEAGLDVQTGGGEVLATIPKPPPVLAATESWPPNVAVARGNLAPLGATVYEVADDADLPFPAGTFDLVVSRHPTLTRWDEIARVLRPGGAYLSQQIGNGTMRELTEAMMGPVPVGTARDPRRAVAAAEAAGLTVVDLREAALRAEFFDVGAVVYFLRKVIWTVPGFTVEAYRERLEALHTRIQAEGSFVAWSRRFLIEARKPGS